MYEKIKKKYLDALMKQRMRNIFYVILIVLTVVIAGFIGIFAVSIYQKEMDKTIEQDNRKLADQLNISMSQYVHRLIQLSDALYYNVLKNNSEYMNQIFQAMYDSHKDSIESIALFDKKGKLLHVTPALNQSSYTDIQSEEWFTAPFQSSENIHFFAPVVYDYFEQNDYFNWVIPLSRYVQMNEGSQVMDGVLLISIKYSAFSEIFGNSALDSARYSFLMDSSGNLVYHPKHAQINAGFMEYPPEVLASYSDGSYKMQIDGSDVLCCVETVGYTGWKLVSVSSREEIQLAGLKYRLFIVAIVLLVLLVSMGISSYLSRVLTNPIQNLEADVKKISEGDLDIKVHASGSFEVYHLGISIQKMTVKIRKLMQAIIKEQEEKRKSELDSLQAQITPHFLYNTLDIIVWMIEEDRRDEASQIVTSLARLLRISLSKGKHIITLEDELEHVRNYLMIQSMRFKNQFTYEVQMQPGIEYLKVIKLIVQPIVENAIYHGMDGMYGDGEILIRAYTEGSDLYISVQDNGMGMRPEQAEALLDYTKEIKTSKGNGLGVRNVHERIQLYFGKEYGVIIKTVVDEGTEVLLHLPMVMNMEKET